MKLKPILNKNLSAILEAYKSGKRGIVLEGGSRSGKTISALDFLFSYSVKVEKSTSVILVKETYNSFKTTLYNDFNFRLPYYNVPSPTQNVKEVQSFNIYDTKFHMMGADQPSKFHGASSDMFYINEALQVEKNIFDQLEMRCRKFWIIDYNPSFSDHWIFGLEKRDDVVFCRSTIFDNPYVGDAEKKKILGYNPEIPENIANGTADDYMWKVYGLGLRASPEGLIFQNVQIIDELPEDYDSEHWGIDFGYTIDPTAVVQVRRKAGNLFAKLRLYTPVDNANTLSELLMKINSNGAYVADSADPGMIASLRRMGVNVHAVGKYPGSIKTGIDIMKRFKLHVVRDPDAVTEVNNYKWRTINGISLNEPIDKYNHFWDAFRYVSMSNFT